VSSAAALAGRIRAMPRFVVHTPETAPEASKPLLAAVKASWGFIPNLQATLAESPPVLEGHEALLNLVTAQATLTPGEQQLVFMAANVYHGCEYCAAGHSFLARKAGLAEDALQAVRNGEPVPDPRLESLRSFATLVLDTRGFAGDAAVDAFLAAGFTRAQVLEVVAILAIKTISNYTNHLTHTPLESFMHDPALRWHDPEGRTARAA
jgi:AhpD family alkylhydroperoxidase